MMNIIQEKICRIQNGREPRVLDLFAGCGGISLGFKTVGFKIIGSVEIDSDALKTHHLNFEDKLIKSGNNVFFAKDITKTDPAYLFRVSQMNTSLDDCVDVIVGGPPCQAFARVGRAKLREVAMHPEAFLHDPRSNLYLRYLDYVRELKPVALLMENVPDVLNFGGHNIAEEVCESLEEMGYECKYTLLNSSMYGVPQMRERMFLLAYAKELNQIPVFPNPTHWVTLPQGYQNSRRVALKTINSSLFSGENHFMPPPKNNPSLQPAVTVKEALADLPKITLHLEGKLKRGARKFTEMAFYIKNDDTNEYINKMRNWVGFENQIGVKDHVIRYLPRDWKLFERMKHGDQYPEAYQHSLQMFKEEIDKLYQSGIKIQGDTPEYERLKKTIVPPYDPNKFPNKWRKMEPDKPARTLMAHLGKDGYSHIHYDSSQARTISVREAARLQSFPDGFVFSGSMNSAFRQIGNAVPPLLALELAKEMIKTLKSTIYVSEISYKKTLKVRPHFV